MHSLIIQLLYIIIVKSCFSLRNFISLSEQNLLIAFLTETVHQLMLT